MPDLKLTINGYGLEWIGDEVSIANLEADVLHAATIARMTPEVMVREAVLAFTGWASDPGTRDMQAKALVYYVLSLDTGHPQHPGKFRDYLPVYDLVIELRVAGRKVRMKIVAAAWPDA